MNNKGQVLVLFIILLPVLLLILTITIQLGNLYLEKTRTTNIIKEIITQNLKQYDETTNEKTHTLLEQNIKDIKRKTIFTSEDEIRIKLEQEKTIFGRNIKIKYNIKGQKQEEKIIISEG